MMPDSLQKALQAHIDNGVLTRDPAQQSAAQALDDLLEAIYDVPQQVMLSRFLVHFLGRKPQPRALQGVYLYGGVGGGKTMLMDMFYHRLPPNLPARRVHFHRFMIEVHDQLHKNKQQSGDSLKDIDSQLPALARHIASRAHVLCFDEFHVEDVADAMILSRLFTALFNAGLFCVMTSNQPPDELYAEGLQRASFLPFIALIHNRMRVIEVAAEQDYREALLQIRGTYFMPLNDQTRTQIDTLFAELSNNANPGPEHIDVRGRILRITAAEGVARASFEQLCQTPLGAEDYWEIARHYHTLILEDVPQLDDESRNAVKRLMTLIDVIYDQGRNLVIAAEVPPVDLYCGDQFALAFRRTASRLKGMNSS